MIKKCLIFIALISFSILGCQDEDTTPPIQNNTLLFTYSQVLEIEQSFDNEGLPIFDISNVDNNLFSIALSIEPLMVEDSEIENQDAIIWRWTRSMTSTNTVLVQDGIFNNGIFTSDPILCQLLELENLYWCAWAWEDSGIRITHSTPVRPLEVDLVNDNQFSIDKVSIIDQNGDTYLEAGEVVTIKITLNCSEEKPLTNVIATLNQPSITELPLVVFLDTIRQSKVDFEFTFTIPVNAGFSESIPLLLDLEYDRCYRQQLESMITVTGRKVCLKSIKLVRIYSDPPNGSTWDDPLQPWCNYDFNDSPASNPDPCYTLSSETAEAIYSNCPSENSGQLIDADPKFPNQSWPPLVQCTPLPLNELHTIRVLDENRPWCEDNEPIGAIVFKPGDFLKNSAPFQVIDSETIQIELELEWQ